MKNKIGYKSVGLSRQMFSISDLIDRGVSNIFLIQITMKGGELVKGETFTLQEWIKKSTIKGIRIENAVNGETFTVDEFIK